MSQSTRSYRPRILTAPEAAGLIPSGATVAIGGLISILCPERVLAAIGERFQKTGQPRDLTVITPVRVGWTPGTGLDHFAQKGLLKRLISGSFSVKDSPLLAELIRINAIEAYSYSMGTLFHWVRAMAGGQTGLITQVGLHTYVDPRHGGGRLNTRTEEDLVQLIEIAGQEHLFYPATPIHVAIIRGTTADARGNISLEQEPATLAGLELAMAARASHGLVIAQVKRLTQAGTLHPRSVSIPGVLVDVVVVDPSQSQSLLPDDPSWTGEIRRPWEDLTAALPLNIRKVILRRAAQEVTPGSVINLGVGVPVELPKLALEEGFFDPITFSLEHGAVGGIPTGEEVFGAHINPEAFISSPQVFDYYHGGGLSLSLLGFAQVDGHGHVNVSYFNGIFRGSGGFIDICHRTPKLLFCGTFTASGADLMVEDGQLQIRHEGRHKKFVSAVEHLTFNADRARANGQVCLYLTERATFRLGERGLVLTEYAPGVDVERDILAHMDCPVEVASDLAMMSPSLFQP